jgi:small conductance mechanosensitive channel
MWSRLEEQFAGAVDSLITLGVGLVEAIIIFLIARFVLRLLRERVLRRFDSPDLPQNRRTLLQVLTTVIVGTVALSVLLALWGVTWSRIVTAISLGTLGLLLGVQDVLKSLFGGVYLILERPYEVGHRITVRDVTGQVIGIELRTTILRSDDGNRIVLPNSIVFTDAVTNFSLQRQIRSDVILTGIDGDPAEERPRIEQVVAAVEGVDGEVEVRFRRRQRVRRPSGEERAAPRRNKPAVPRGAEVWVSWLGAGEPETMADVVTQLQLLYPTARIRRRKTRPQRSIPVRRSSLMRKRADRT